MNESIGGEYVSEKDFKLKRKESFLVMIMFISFVFLVAFGFASLFVEHNVIRAAIDFILAGLTLVMFIVHYRIKKIIFMSIVTVVFFIAYLIIIILNGGFFNYGILWAFSLPIVVFYIAGKKTGVLVLLVFHVLIAVMVILGQFKIIEFKYTIPQYFYISAVYALISTLTFLYEDTAVKSEWIIRNQALFNPMTKLPNYLKLRKDLGKIAHPCTLIMINIDNFRIVNELYGNKTGDQTIVEVSLMLKQLLRKQNNGHLFLYKLHSDEFAVLIDCSVDDEKLIELTYLVSNQLNTKLTVNDNYIALSVSLGIAHNSDNPLFEADMALNFAKEQKRNYIIFDKTMDRSSKLKEDLLWIDILKTAVKNDNIIPYFQPILNNRTNEIEKYECLIRLIENNRVITPGFFLGIAKKARIYPVLTAVMVKNSFDFFKNKNISFSINVSVDDILNRETANFIYHYLNEYNIGPRTIFELTESEEIEDNIDVQTFINNIKQYGAKIAIDDFGTGYSNFGNILKMNIDYIKLDGTLIKNIDSDPNMQIIAETIVNFARKLNIETIAEYVHSSEVHEKVKSIGIDYSQGYFIGEPKPDILQNSR
ncbi:MAG: EAL domain-containing protein [Spirochaetales bacterium]|nr:EAL domain-containing protein [Spirochaetales bacterium]